MPVPTHDRENCKTLIFSPFNCKCSMKVYLFVCTCGSSVYFEDLYPYWTKHECNHYLIDKAVSKYRNLGFNNEEIYNQIVNLGSKDNLSITAESETILQNLLSQFSIDFEKNIDLSGKFETTIEDVENIDADLLEKIINLEKKMISAQPKVKNYISEKIERGKVADLIKDLKCNKCLICEKLNRDPYAFMTKKGKHYIEVHHVIPVSTRQIGVLSSTNLITVCANHHRELHYGDVMTEILYDRFHFHFGTRVIEIKKIKLDEYNNIE